MIVVGPYKVRNNLFLAPLVGISDVPFREICSEQGAGLTIGEMLTCNTDLWNNERNRFKQIKSRINEHQVVQIVGSDPGMMANAAQLNVDMGATAIDINMGCPAKKVLKKAAGSALLKNPSLVARILRAVVLQVNVPVTLKIRTGWCPATRNGVEISKIAEDCGIQLLSVHGRTRECRFNGKAEYDTIAAIKQAVSIPIIANGDIHCSDSAKQVLQYTKADGLMIGRAAQGQPWLFKEIEYFLATGKTLPILTLYQKLKIIESHLKKLHSFYGEAKGVWYARKHVASYVKNLPQGRIFLANFNRIESGLYQLETVNSYFDYLTGDERVVTA